MLLATGVCVLGVGRGRCLLYICCFMVVVAICGCLCLWALLFVFVMGSRRHSQCGWSSCVLMVAVRRRETTSSACSGENHSGEHSSVNSGIHQNGKHQNKEISGAFCQILCHWEVLVMPHIFLPDSRSFRWIPVPFHWIYQPKFHSCHRILIFQSFHRNSPRN